MIIKDQIATKSNEFLNLCLKHQVRYLYAFGSSTSDTFDEKHSDIDLLVELDVADPIERGEKLLSLWDLFEKFFKRRVDLLTEASIHNPFLRKSIDSTKILIYDGTGQKIFI
jgi:predicted nucleotidyltransferase